MSAKKPSRKRGRRACVRGSRPGRRVDRGDHLRARVAHLRARRRALADCGRNSRDRRAGGRYPIVSSSGGDRVGRVDEAREIEVVGNRRSAAPGASGPISSALWQQSFARRTGAHRPVVVGDHVLEQGVARRVGGVEVGQRDASRAHGSGACRCAWRRRRGLRGNSRCARRSGGRRRRDNRCWRGARGSCAESADCTSGTPNIRAAHIAGTTAWLRQWVTSFSFFWPANSEAAGGGEVNSTRSGGNWQMSAERRVIPRSAEADRSGWPPGSVSVPWTGVLERLRTSRTAAPGW